MQAFGRRWYLFKGLAIPGSILRRGEGKVSECLPYFSTASNNVRCSSAVLSPAGRSSLVRAMKRVWCAFLPNHHRLLQKLRDTKRKAFISCINNYWGLKARIGLWVMEPPQGQLSLLQLGNFALPSVNTSQRDYATQV